MEFNNTATKLRIKQDSTVLQKIVKDGSRLSTIARAHLQDSATAEQIKKRKSESESNPDSKLLSYRERSKQRYNTPATNAPNTPLLANSNNHVERTNSAEHFLTEKESETLPASFEVKPITSDTRETTVSVNEKLQKKESKPQEKAPKIINEAALPKLPPK